MNEEYLYLYIYNGNNLLLPHVLETPLDDGAWYSVLMQFAQDSLSIFVQGDGERCSTIPCLMKVNFVFDSSFLATFVIGDFSSFFGFSQQLYDSLPVQAGIVGCVRNLRFAENATIQSLDAGFNDSHPSEPGCPREAVCAPNPCVNGGECVASWDSYSCQCLPAYTGTNCSEG